jgi:hypothetical protein
VEWPLAGADTHAHFHAPADEHSNRYLDGHPDRYGDGDQHTYGQANGHAYALGHCDAYTVGHGNAYAAAYGGPNTGSRPVGDSQPNRYADCCADRNRTASRRTREAGYANARAAHSNARASYTYAATIGRGIGEAVEGEDIRQRYRQSGRFPAGVGMLGGRSIRLLSEVVNVTRLPQSDYLRQG